MSYSITIYWEYFVLSLFLFSPSWPTFFVVTDIVPYEPLPTYHQTNFKFNINRTSEAKGIADHVTLLRLFYLSLVAPLAKAYPTLWSYPPSKARSLRPTLPYGPTVPRRPSRLHPSSSPYATNFHHIQPPSTAFN